jgi:hypothetical protein
MKDIDSVGLEQIEILGFPISSWVTSVPIHSPH